MSSAQTALVEALKGCVNEMHRVLESTKADKPHFDGDRFHERLTAANAALAQAEAAQPVATVAEVHMSRYTLEWTNGPLPEGTPLYGAPQPAEAAQPNQCRCPGKGFEFCGCP